MPSLRRLAIHPVMFRVGIIARVCRAGVAWALIAHVALVLAMAVCPDLHRALHADADDRGHECAVTLFASGGVAHGAAPLLAPEPPRIELPEVRALHAAEVAAVFLLGAVLEHAPPVVS